MGWLHTVLLSKVTIGAIHSTKISGSFGLKLNGSVLSNRKSFRTTGPLFEVDHFSRSEFWLNGLHPMSQQFYPLLQAVIEYRSDDVIKMKFAKLWDLLRYSEKPPSKTPTREKLAIRANCL